MPMDAVAAGPGTHGVVFELIHTYSGVSVGLSRDSYSGLACRLFIGGGGAPTVAVSLRRGQPAPADRLSCTGNRVGIVRHFSCDFCRAATCRLLGVTKGGRLAWFGGVPDGPRSRRRFGTSHDI